MTVRILASAGLKTGRYCGCCAALWCIALLSAPMVGAEPAAPAPEAVGRKVPVAADLSPERQTLAKLLDALDDNRYDYRQDALRQLTLQAGDSPQQPWLAEQVQQRLFDPATSFEARQLLQELSKLLPMAGVSLPAAQPSNIDLADLVRKLSSNQYATRLGAAERVDWLARQPSLGLRLKLLLDEQLDSPQLDHDTRQRLRPLWDRARGTWLLSDPATWQLPPVSTGQIDQWLADLVRPLPKNVTGRPWFTHDYAQRHLVDLLARDEYVAPLAARIKSLLEQPNLEVDAYQRLSDLHDLTQPAMVAEIWQDQQHVAIQHLLVDVPRQTAGAIRPSHFDRIDENTAHCVSGSNLVEGEYPVGQAVPHPERPGWMCHLVNLPVPRRRLAYDYQVQADMHQRLAALTERTLKSQTSEKRLLTEMQILLLEQLDAATVSRLIGAYLLAADDQRITTTNYPLGGPLCSHHARICFQLAILGTKEAGPGILAAIRQSRFLPPQADGAPCDWPWIAALSIAARDPWDEVERWLVETVGDARPLVLTDPDHSEFPVPERGATAAALLLERHGMVPAAFGLDPVESEELNEVGLRGYYFAKPTGRRQVQDWWAKRKTETTAAP